MLSPKQLEEYLEVMREHGATRYACPEFSVTLGPAPVEVDEDDDLATAIKQAATAERLPSVARGIFGHPSLWPNGRPPTFPGSERSTPTHKPTHPDEE